ncbi:MAG TPA: ketopantoate reductase family protein [Xanthobacteraceae bacterium]|nr:ketopantoate reductase family protein [Xanthobacteraceae bacterium]
MNDGRLGKVAVMGAGAVGCYYGGMLARAGADVTLIGRPRHMDAVNAHGLVLERREGRETVALKAAVDPSAVRGARLVLFCVKSTATEAAARAIAPHLAPDALVLSLQNGVDNAERLRAATERAVIPAVVYVGCAMAGPGHVKHNGRGDLVIGVESPDAASALRARLADIAAAFSAAGVPVRISDNVIGELWVKLAINCAYNALSALTRGRYGFLIGSEPARRLMEEVVQEIEALAAKKGVRLADPKLRDTVYAVAGAMPDQTSSTEQDIARGQTTEIDHLNGYVARQGEALGVPTPVNRTLYALVKVLEAKSGA